MPDSRDAVIVGILYDAARLVATGPGRKQAWLSEVWEQIVRNGKADGMEYREFQDEVTRLCRNQEISLAPAPRALSAEMQDEADRSELVIDGRSVCMLNIPASHQASHQARPGISPFAERVLAIARSVGPSFGDRKVFIGDIWGVAQRDPVLGALGEQEFKRRLLDARQAGQLVLSRADLVAAMDPRQVAASETHGVGAEFHFVNIDPVKNPARRAGLRRHKSLPQLVRNPPSWVADLIAGSYETLEDTVDASWLPRLQDMKRLGKDEIIGKAKEYGCGVHGCVFPTLDPAIVLKVTDDDGEAQFAATMASTLVAPICVRYHMAMKLDAKRDGNDVFLLWRDSAEHVGELDKYLDERSNDPIFGDTFMDLVNAQHHAANEAYVAFWRKWPAKKQAPLMNAWVDTLREIAEQSIVPELAELAAGMLEVYLEQHIAIMDVHSGNIGLVNGKFVITDPGHVAVIEQ